MKKSFDSKISFGVLLLYIWIRRFKNLDHKQKLYKDVYESDEWINNIAPKVEKLIDRNTIVVHNLSPTALSIMK